MKEVVKPAPITALVAFLVLAVIGQYTLAAIALVIWIGLLVVGQIRAGGAQRAVDPREAMDADSRTLFSPIRRLTDDIETMVEKNRDDALMRTIGAEARTEAQRIRDQIARALAIRSELVRALRGRSTAAIEADDLEKRAQEATSPAEREALASASEARRLELTHYATVEESLKKIDGGVRQAEAALSEIKARLAVGATSKAAAEADQTQDLRESLSRLKALSLTVDETESLLKD